VTVNNGIGVVDLSAASGAIVIVSPGYLDITGTGNAIVNNGSISVGPGDGLAVFGSSATLSGKGTVTITDPSASFHGTAGNPGPTLINQQTIQGQGTLGIGMNITNQGAINANAGTLNVEPNSMTNTGTLEASAGSTLFLESGLAPVFNNTGGTVVANNGGTVQLQGSTWMGGTLKTVGSGVIQASGSVFLNGLTIAGNLQVITAALQNTITNSGKIQVSGTLSASGSATLTGTGSVTMSGTAFLRSLTGTDTLVNQQLVHGSGTISELPLTNQGTISADSSSNTLTLFEGTTVNTATMNASGGGVLSIQNTVANTGGTIEAFNGSTVDILGTIQGGTLKTSGTGAIDCQDCTLDGTVNAPTNAGTLTVANSDLYVQGTIHNTGTIALTGNSCVEMNEATTFTGSGTLTMEPGTCVSGGGNSFTNQSAISGGGSIGGSSPMPIVNNGTIIANQTSPLTVTPNAAGFSNTGKLTANAGSTLNINGLFTNLSSGTLSGGTYTVAGILGLQNPVAVNAANITLTGAAAEISNDGSNALSTLAANQSTGVLTFQNGQVLTTSAAFTNSGKLTIGAGSGFQASRGYTQTAGKTTVDGTLTASGHLLLEKGSLQGQGVLAAEVVSYATVTAGDSTTTAGALTISGSYTQNSTGILDVAIGGTQTGAGYSQVAVSHAVSLNGTLNITLLNGFLSAIGNTFTILTGSAITGTFATVNGLSIDSGEHFEIGYTGSAVTLTVASGT
jgi:hypothetical protein